MSLLLLFDGVAAGYQLTANAGSYAFTGTAASLRHSDLIGAGPGSYAFTGTAATLKLGRKVSAGTSSYAFTGTPATLLLGRKIAAGAGSYSFTGTAATLKLGRLASAGAGSYLFTGTAATLTYTVPNHYSLVPDAGAYLFTGTAATLRYVPIVPDLMDMHDGISRAKPQEVELENYRKQKRSVRKALEKQFYGPEPEPVKPVEVAQPKVPELKKLPVEISQILEQAMAPVMDNAAPTIDPADVVREYLQMQAEATRRANDELAIVLLLTS